MADVGVGLHVTIILDGCSCGRFFVKEKGGRNYRQSPWTEGDRCLL